MSINLIVLDGVVKSMALRFDAEAKPELRFTLQQTDHATDGKPWVSYWPCCASGSAATRLAEVIEDGQHILVTSGKLVYRKRTTKAGEQSRMEILCWQVDVLSESPQDERESDDASPGMSGGEIVQPEPTGDVAPTQKRVSYAKT